MAQSKEYAVTGKIVPINGGTRLRTEPSTFTHVLNSYAKDAQVEIDLVHEYTETILAEYVKIGDKWGRVTKINGVAIVQPAWMAIVYLGSPICQPAYSLVGTPPTEPIPPTVPGKKVKILSLTVIAHYEDGTSETNDFDPVV